MSTDVAEVEKQIVLETVQWARLEYIEDLEPISDRDYDVLKELRDILLRHGYQDRFGVCLLHKHFDLQPGEAALEESDAQSRVSTIKVVPQESCKDAMETAWRFSPDVEIHAGRNCEVKCHGFGMTGHSRRHVCKGPA
jgi:hypothetical protein